VIHGKLVKYVDVMLDLVPSGQEGVGGAKRAVIDVGCDVCMYDYVRER